MKVGSNYNLQYTKTSFSSRKSVLEKSDNFADELICIANRGRLPFRTVKKTISSYDPELKVKKITFWSPERYFGGTYSYSIAITPDGRDYCIQDDILKISSGSKIDLLTNTVHEMVHAFQAYDEEMSPVSSYRKYIPKSQYKESLEISKKLHKFALTEGVYPQFLAIFDAIPSDEKSIMKIVSERSKKFQEALYNYMETIKKSYPNVNLALLKDSAVTSALSEVDAHKKELDVLKKMNKDKNQKALKAIILARIYQNVADTFAMVG